MALLLRLNRRRATSSRTLFFSTSNSDSNSGSNSPFSSHFRDVRERLKQPSSPSSNPRSQPPSANEIRKNLSEFRAKTAPPPPGNPSQQQQQFSFQQIYQRHNVQGNPPRLGESSSPSMQFIRENLRNLSAAQTPVSQGRPGMIGGTNALPQGIFGKEMRKEGTKSTTMFSAGFLKTYNVEDLGKKLRMLRPEGKEKGWFSVRELSERLVRLRKMEEEQARSNTRDSTINIIRGCLAEINEEQNLAKKKASLQGHSILNHLSGAPTFSLEPPIPHLVEKYFHPDNMSSSEKMKIELAKVRDEFKMSESDCGSARVQIAQLTTKIKHLSAVLHKKDVHSRKGLVAMVQRRKRLLKYLRRTDWDSYCFVISKLGLRDNPDHSYRSRTSMAT
ncbi:hypothetical protein LR48_Vigan05g003400 [Vigna angularis]|uniref:Small ribosomal subunit protein uS15c n=2 Tax=Phaseolus angularis TaxID=3914 RepID=A0A0L9UHQ3_PHAAN|nr:uncharacterized protein LOC108334498 isoform X1 [Vigna angularis]KAG2372518.1 uncharacterized protein HKW66_Vig0206130 [Vigna angularis]KOM42430.1 hypothetical protein LR48_Vigan05g003400 [Vigna angularis]BAT93377.1 hypothetical protein VIGAN_07232700 [Vigna angularis var. angularis]